MIKRLISVAIISLLLAPLPVDAQAALSYNISQTVEIDANDQARVRYEVSVKGNPDSDSLQFAVAGLNINDPAATIDGSQTDVSVATAENDALFPHSVATISLTDSVDSSWKFALEYETDSLMQRTQNGGTYLIVSAPTRQAEVSKETVSVELPLGSELPRAFGLQPNQSTVDGEQQRYEYEFNGARNSAVVLLFGGSHTNSFNLQATLKNDSWWWRTQQLALPPDTALQQAFLASVTPEPTNVRLDEYGNMFVEYRLAPRSSVALDTILSLKTKSVQFDLDSAASVVDAASYESYLDTSGRYANGQVLVEDSPVELAQAVLRQSRENESTTVELVASARASGLPAREVRGWIAAFSQAEPVVHEWAEVFIPDVGWIVLDPQMAGEFISFGRSGSWRIRGAIIIDQSAATAFSTAQNQSLNWAEISEGTEISFEPTVPQLQSNNYVLLPGISLRRTTVTLPAGVVRDNVGFVTSDDQLTRLGSLAPLQTAVRSEIAVLGDSFSSEQLEVGVIADNQFDELASESVNTNWLPFAGLTALVAAIFGYRWWSDRRKKGKSVVTLNQPDEIDMRSSEELLQSDVDERR